MYRALMLTVVAIQMTCFLTLASCSGTDSSGLTPVSNPELRTDTAVAEVEGAACPAGVDQLLWQRLTRELAAILKAHGGSKLVSRAPVGESNIVSNLSVQEDGAGPVVNWTYVNTGDYDQNSEVNIADLTPIALFFGARAGEPDWLEASLADGDANGEVNISDISPIGLNYQHRLSGYVLQTAPQADAASWEDVATIPFSQGQLLPEGGRLAFMYELPGAVSGNYYRVRAHDSQDMSLGEISNQVQYISEVQPSNLTATQGTEIGTVNLDWDVVSDATSYTVFRSDSGIMGFSELGTTGDATPGYSDNTVLEGVHYFYRVAGELPTGPSAQSATAEGWSMTVPAAPLNLSASDGLYTDRVELAWVKSDGAETYTVFRDDQETPLVELGDVNSFADTSLADTIVHTYWVAAGNQVGQSEVSLPDGGNVGVIPDPPNDVLASDAEFADKIHLSWAPSAGAVSYEIYRDSQVSPIAAIGAIATFDDTGVADFELHTYWIKAVSSAGTSGFSASDQGSLAIPLPEPPTNMTASDGTSTQHISLSWTRSPLASGYLVYRDSQAVPIAILGDVDQFDDVAPTYMQHEYWVQASNAAGESGFTESDTGHRNNRSDWWMFGRNALRRSLGTAAGPAANTLDWSYSTGSWIRSSPAIAADGTVYFGNYDGKLYAMNPDGTKRWEYQAGADIYSSPAIASDGTVYVGSHDFKLHAVNPDGTGKWIFTTSGIVRSSPAIGDDGRIYFGSNDWKVYALNPDGTEAWSYLTGEQVRSSPALAADGTVYVGAGKENRLYALNPDGSLKWSYTASGWVRSSPAIAPDGTVYVGSSDGKLHAVNPTNGSQKWVFSASGYIENCSPAIGANGRVYIGSGDSNLYCLNPATGAEIWRYPTGADIDSSPMIDSAGYIYVGSDDFKLHSINPLDGSQRWEYSTGALVDSPPAIADDGTIYFGSSDGSFYAIGPGS